MSDPSKTDTPPADLNYIEAPRFREAAGRILKALSEDRKVLAAGIFGSAAEGRTWEGSDLDVLVVVSGDDPELRRGIELLEGDVRVHLQYLSLAALERAARESRGSPFSRAVAHSRLAFCRDDGIDRIRAELAAFPEINRRLRELVTLSGLKAALNRAEKLVYLEEPLGAFPILTEAFVDLARLKLYLRGQYPGRDPTGQVLTSEPGLIAQFKDFCDGVLPLEERLDRAVEYLHETAEELVPLAAMDLLEFLAGASGPMSTEEIEEHERYKDLPIVFPELLEWLCDLGFLSRGTRPFSTAITPARPDAASAPPDNAPVTPAQSGRALNESVYTPASRR